jgi:hypothetical protein
MSQLHLYLPEHLAGELRRRAAAKGLSVSAYLAELVRSQIADEWPEGFFDNVIGGWIGEPLPRPRTLEPETREELDVPAGHERMHSPPE